MNKTRWFIWGGVGTVAVIGILLAVLNASLHTLRSTGKTAPRTAGQVAFVNLTNFYDRKLTGDVYMLNVDSGELTQLTSGEDVYSFEWSPDGESLYLRNRSAARGVSFTHRLNVSTGELTALASDYTLYTGQYISTVSPDGHQFLYSMPQTLYRTSGKIIVSGLDGSSPRTLGNGGEPAWSPDGKRIVYSWYQKGDAGSDIYTMAADGSDVQKVVSLPDQDLLPAWSPDGKTIVFGNFKLDQWGSVRDGTLYRVDVDGKNLVKLGDVIEPYMLRVLPDGKTVYAYGSGATCLTPMDGGQQVCKYASSGDLSPDGKRVIMSLQDSLSPFQGPTNVRLCLGLIDGAHLTDGPCVYSAKIDLTAPLWRPG